MNPCTGCNNWQLHRRGDGTYSTCMKYDYKYECDIYSKKLEEKQKS